MSNVLMCSGVLPFYDDGKSVFLGREFRRRYNDYFWTGFGGKQEVGETLAETACREYNEETAQVLKITLEQVLSAEHNNHYIDHLNEKTNTFYRMYCIKVDGIIPSKEVFEESAKNLTHVEKVEWRCFSTVDVVNSQDGVLPGTESKIYSTTIIHLAKLRDSEFFKSW